MTEPAPADPGRARRSPVRPQAMSGRRVPASRGSTAQSTVRPRAGRGPCTVTRAAGCLALPPFLLLASSPALGGALEPALARAVAAEHVSGVTSPSTDGPRWPVTLVVASDAVDGPTRARLEAALAALQVERKGPALRDAPRVWEVSAPYAVLHALADLELVDHVTRVLGPQLPPDPLPVPALAAATEARTGTVVSEALEEMRVPELHALGITGRGIRIGVVDVGFEAHRERIGSELPETVTYRRFSDAEESNQSHGTACAEVIADVAPECELYLAEIASSVDLQEALDWFIAEDVEILSHSLAWFLGGGDGTGPIVELTRAAADEGIHWVTSSGNFRRSFWQGRAGDDDRDGYVELGDGGDENIGIVPGTTTTSISLVLNWNAWPLSEGHSFQIEIWDGDTLLGTSATDFGDDYPFAFREIAVTSTAVRDPNFRIRAIRGDPAGIQLRVFRVDGGFLAEDERVEAGSLAVPADSPHALAVGAYSVRTTGLESFSSHGPTGAGLAKPDLVAADAVSTSLPRFPRFVGTSAACPHVAGAVALLLSAGVAGGAFDLHWSREEVGALLRGSADPLAGTESEAQGWGRLRLPVGPVEMERSRLRLAAAGPDGFLFTLEHRVGTDPPPYLGIHDVGGRRVAGAPAGSSRPASPRGNGPIAPHRFVEVEYTLRTSSAPLPNGRYWAVDPVSGASVPFYFQP